MKAPSFFQSCRDDVRFNIRVVGSSNTSMAVPLPVTCVSRLLMCLEAS